MFHLKIYLVTKEIGILSHCVCLFNQIKLFTEQVVMKLSDWPNSNCSSSFNFKYSSSTFDKHYLDWVLGINNNYSKQIKRLQIPINIMKSVCKQNHRKDIMCSSL